MIGGLDRRVLLDRQGAERALATEADFWRAWLFDTALPLWAEHGCNPAGGFYDSLDDDLAPAADFMRLRVQARQVYVFAQVAKLGWSGPWRAMVRHGMDFLLNVASGDDGLVAHRFDLNGVSLGDPCDLYDQAFALLAYALAFETTGDERARTAALRLMTRLEAQRDPEGGYRELPGYSPVLRANPQMHLLEAVLAWRALDAAPVWRRTALELAQLCERKLADPRTGALTEFFDDGWRPAAGDIGRVTEPGHHYEWAWLLMQQSAERDELASLLCDRAERFGVDQARGVAVNVIDTDGRLLDGTARMWPQCERLRVALTLRARDPAWTGAALQASRALARYIEDGPPGLWRDLIGLDGSLRPQPAPVSSLYHIVSALSELLKPSTRARSPARVLAGS